MYGREAFGDRLVDVDAEAAQCGRAGLVATFGAAGVAPGDREQDGDEEQSLHADSDARTPPPVPPTGRVGACGSVGFDVYSAQRSTACWRSSAATSCRGMPAV